MIYKLYKSLPLSVLGRFYEKIISRYPKLANYTRTGGAWRVESVSEETMTLKDGAISLIECRHHGTIPFFEWLSWKYLYLPKMGLVGKTVLDIGSGCGETAAFFFKHGAKKVIAVERNPKCAMNLLINKGRNHWEMEIFPEPFNLNHLAIQHDFLKIDIEGDERLLLGYDRPLGPCRIEMHEVVTGIEVRNRLVKKFGLERIPSPGTEMFGLD